MLFLQTIVERLETEEQIKTAEQIFENYRNAMFQIAYHILENTNDAEDAVSDTIIKVCRHIDDFKSLPSLEQKLLVKKFTERTAIDKWRELKRKPSEDLSDYILETTESESTVFGYEENITFSGEKFGILQKHILKIPKKYRDVLVLRYVNDLKNKEIAELLNIPESTVATHISRAKQLLKRMLEQERNELYGKDE